MKAATILLFCAGTLLASGGCSRDRPEVVGTDSISGKVATSYESALSAARQQNKPLLLVTYQGSGEMVDQMILGEPLVFKKSAQFVIAKLDAAAQPGTMTQLGVMQHPTMILMRPDGTQVWRKRAPSPAELSAVMDRMLGPPPGA